MATENILPGGLFLIKDTDAKDVYVPEQANEEQLMIMQMVKDFLDNEILANAIPLDKQEEGLAAGLLEKMAELGLLGTHLPEEYGGMQLDNPTNTMIGDAIGPAGGFSVTYAVQTGIGVLPILYFGTKEQKETYLPKIISAELKMAYCLTEPGSGSDALAAKTKAILSEDGTHYVVTGQKMWISNAGFADKFIVFAQVDGDKFTGFIIDGDADGLTLGEEEDKLGIKASSTRMVFLDGVKVPVENVLGEIGQGHKLAFNALNIGRFKLCVLAIGASKRSITTAIQYANERQQFKTSIANFGAIKHKLAEQAIQIFASDSAMYRVSGLLEEWKKKLMAEGMSFSDAKLAAAEEYAIECALLKVSGSEALDFVVDETLQIHGGMGISEEGTAARAYRDARINRIYEGTNEINRLLSVDMLLKRALKGRLDLIGPAWDVQKELASMPSFDQPEGEYGHELKAIKDFKKALLMVAGGAAKMQMDGHINLKHEQEILMNVSDMMIDILLAESMLLRTIKLAGMETKHQSQEVYEAMTKVFIHDATARINKNATDAIASFAEGDLLRTFSMGLKRFTKYPLVNVKNERRKIADALIKANEYCFF